jgi:hypothetical protein
MAQMAYAEVALGVNMDWSIVSTRLQAQQNSNMHHKIPWLIKTRPSPLSGLPKVLDPNAKVTLWLRKILAQTLWTVML